MKFKFLPPFLAFILVLTTTPISEAQNTNPDQQTTAADWQGLSKLKHGKQILIEYRSNVGGTLECKFISVFGSKLTISDGDSTATIEQADIERVYELKGKWSRNKMAKIGAAIGMVVGAVVGAGTGLRIERQPDHINSENDTVPLFAGFAIGTVAGAGIGALTGGKRKGKLLYEAK